jgi:hypothetical protein
VELRLTLSSIQWLSQFLATGPLRPERARTRSRERKRIKGQMSPKRSLCSLKMRASQAVCARCDAHESALVKTGSMMKAASELDTLR